MKSVFALYPLELLDRNILARMTYPNCGMQIRRGWNEVLIISDLKK
jgi:hypothetical protein